MGIDMDKYNSAVAKYQLMGVEWNVLLRSLRRNVDYGYSVFLIDDVMSEVTNRMWQDTMTFIKQCGGNGFIWAVGSTACLKALCILMRFPSVHIVGTTTVSLPNEKNLYGYLPIEGLMVEIE